MAAGGGPALKVTALILGRLDSTRLPGKVLTDLGGRPIVDHVVERVRRMPGVDRMVLATSGRAVDDALAAHGESLADVDVFRGSAEDVLGRCADAARAWDLDAVVRISADSPFLDPAICGRVVAAAVDDVEVATNVFPRTFPVGTSAEVVVGDALARLAREATDRHDREHVTTYVYDHPDRFRIRNVEAVDGRYEGLHVAVDEPADLDRARWVVDHADDPLSLDLDEVLASMRQWEDAGCPEVP